MSNAKAGVEVRQYVLGDIDNFVYDGPGSVDDVYVDPDWQNYWDLRGLPLPAAFDVLSNDNLVPFTFVFDFAPNEYIIGATLSLGLRGGDGSFRIGPDGSLRANFGDLGWYLSSTETAIYTINLADFFGSNLIPHLHGGIFSAAAIGHVGIDYAQLTLQIVPEPATLLLLAIGLLSLRKRQ